MAFSNNVMIEKSCDSNKNNLFDELREGEDEQQLQHNEYHLNTYFPDQNEENVSISSLFDHNNINQLFANVSVNPLIYGTLQNSAAKYYIMDHNITNDTTTYEDDFLDIFGNHGENRGEQADSVDLIYEKTVDENSTTDDEAYQPPSIFHEDTSFSLNPPLTPLKVTNFCMDADKFAAENDSLSTSLHSDHSDMAQENMASKVSSQFPSTQQYETSNNSPTNLQAPNGAKTQNDDPSEYGPNNTYQNFQGDTVGDLLHHD
jgi:hypothetical protein